MLIARRYALHIHAVRSNASVQTDLMFHDASADGAINRLRAAVALYNDLRPFDHALVRLIFSEELKMKRKYKHYQIQHLKFYGLLLTRFRSPADVWLLFEAHKIDREFNIEFCLSMGVFQIHFYLATVDHELKGKLQRAIGLSYQKSKFSEEEIAEWRNAEEIYYYEKFRFIQENQLDIAALLEDEYLVNKLLPTWVEQHETWSIEDARRYAYYSLIADDIPAQIKSRELYISQFDDELCWTYMNYLVELYIQAEQYQDAINMLVTLLGKPEGQKLRVHYFTKLRALIAVNEKKLPAGNEAVELVKQVADDKRDLLMLIEKAILNLNSLN